ncbi:hypothetical protein EYF80_019620 [Liparis tanakae]|uniref:Uncharacterized protein n=1 Tax=Liparis tanakae TaxID=230148 RepID=A0A4Z2HX58_9TELE|nr:hypothetical protein EYF80_019620 [Liparis tanakae]
MLENKREGAVHAHSIVQPPKSTHLWVPSGPWLSSHQLDCQSATQHQSRVLLMVYRLFGCTRHQLRYLQLHTAVRWVHS